MTLRLSSLSLRAIVVLVVSRQKGITLVFKNDPLESVNVSSSFDGVESVAGYIQREIEGQLREAFRSDLPGVIHRLSQKWLSGEVKSATEGAPVGNGNGFERDAKIETRTAYIPRGEDGDMRKASGKGRGLVTKMSSMSVGGDSVSIASDADTSFSTMPGDPRTHSLLAQSRRRSRVVAAPSSQMRDDPLQSVPESIEAYDPTYGLRPDAIPLHAGFAEYERLVRSGTAGGFGDILGDAEADDLFDIGEPVGDGSFELIGLRDLVEDGRESSMPQWDLVADEEGYRSRYAFDSLGSPSAASGFETIPAVGGGTITRPRIFHTQSQMRTGTASSGSLSHGSPSTTTARAMGQGSASSTMGPPGRAPSSLGMAPFAGMSIGGSGSSTPTFPFHAHGQGAASFASSPSMPRNDSLPSFQRGRLNLHRKSLSLSNSTLTSPPTTRRSSSLFPSTLASSYSSPPSSIPSAPIETGPSPPPRRHPIDLLSRSPSSILSTSYEEDSDLPITLHPTRNDSCAQLATLTHSNQTLSPFIRAHEHFTARSSPHVVSRPGSSRSAPGLRVGGTEPPVKAKRKRVHRIGAAKEVARPGSPRSVQESFLPERGRSSKAPSEMSDYFPSLGGVAREGLRRAREGIAREFWDADRY